MRYYTSVGKATLKEEKLEELNLKSYNKLLNQLEEYENTLADLGAHLRGFRRLPSSVNLPKHYSEEEDILESKRISDIEILYLEFKKEFKEKTNININLEYDEIYGDDDENDDDVLEFYFSVDISNLYQEAESIKKFGVPECFNCSYYVHIYH